MHATFASVAMTKGLVGEPHVDQLRAGRLRVAARAVRTAQNPPKAMASGLSEQWRCFFAPSISPAFATANNVRPQAANTEADGDGDRRPTSSCWRKADVYIMAHAIGAGHPLPPVFGRVGTPPLGRKGRDS